MLKTINPILHFLNGSSHTATDMVLVAGISFFTFHNISYVVDTYRGVKSRKSFINASLYISFFPQLIAGPIIRYHTIADQLVRREVSIERFSDGIRRFIQGLAKKVLIANTLAPVVDSIFAVSPLHISGYTAWLGVIFYGLQIYYDFSGYSDMAIGLAKMFGFTFMENFNYPYISQSITDFWRRWHISLSTWFRDYVYIPLGGNRKGEKRTYVNLFLVFILCGIWHGASWNFLVWGIWYGTFLALEKWRLLKVLDGIWQPWRHLYTLLIVVLGWVFFRSPDLHYALSYINTMFFRLSTNYPDAHTVYLYNEVILAIALGALFSVPVGKIIQERFLSKADNFSLKFRIGSNLYWLTYISMLVLLFILSAMSLSANTYNPFIYYQF